MPDENFWQLANPYRRELLAHCYRLLGSSQDAEDLVQDTMLRAWQAYDGFHGRASLRTWLYRIATNACLNVLKSAQRRVLPSGLGAGTDAVTALTKIESVPWLGPLPTTGADPAELAALRASTRLAVVAAFQRLPPRQRAVLMLVDVASFRVQEAAESLGMTTAAARSALQRARATLAADTPVEDEVTRDPGLDEEVLRRYLKAFEDGDTAGLARLLRTDVEYQMPPFVVWFHSRDAVLDHHTRRVFTTPRRALPTSANGFPAVGSYSQAADGSFTAHAIHVLEAVDGVDGVLARIVVFLDPALFPAFRLPERLPG
ncbi:RNA polymerase subunit sigma-70 [Labedaea rhizosphaerae]|uniref:RNA polymerase sigma factor n=1 Tax=Labedaea rhizosphaerae TaxID=598644 RepID=A0A4R6SFJ5_LABRH|nr:RNA polymerase subunit sigma-70 [Labedaea rhizosphaerae]TDQ00280.1 RNA polymerase sigma-70 factor (ECF subfamily) [Labedaea rhizosphaerae]